eukprot:CAMPEP_0117008516 /NCGR_PEP_ID=MMETSP0472-20121206/8002_1 /TAXON_ID=693140 ORGANISM="Tiarina fusus, Strain LIS" /NCGR_SAMPLE_ID=MMETSP0472 /ASSEMBLY_ACC=CAM_ASM_000603 /LENGTH=49 /DNA_ID= /DNA_START= /DNA_END= /DNA_ORIENTATION=
MPNYVILASFNSMMEWGIEVLVNDCMICAILKEKNNSIQVATATSVVKW